MIALIDYGMGNLRSVFKALETVGARVEVVSTPPEISAAEAVILPGVGNFGDGMERLRSAELDKSVLRTIAADKPFLGICLGMQMLMEGSEEAPGQPGLGIYSGQVVRFPEGVEKVPHMGWNSIEIRQAHPCLAGVDDGTFFYFVHSYFVKPKDDSASLAICDYILPFAAAIGGGNVFATQFHPEKSQDDGLRILRNFVHIVEGKL